MAIARGAGTEIIRSAHFEYIASETASKLIILGEQHHIYTVLSIVAYANQGCDGLKCYLLAYDSLAGESDQAMYIFNSEGIASQKTYVWNDKFSFNGYEPADFASGGLTVTADQDKLADQASSAPQALRIQKNHNNDQFHVHVTYIDQNNA